MQMVLQQVLGLVAPLDVQLSSRPVLQLVLRLVPQSVPSPLLLLLLLLARKRQRQGCAEWQELVPSLCVHSGWQHRQGPKAVAVAALWIAHLGSPPC